MKKTKWEFHWKSTEWLFSSTVSRLNWNLEMLLFVEGGKPEYEPGKKPSEQGWTELAQEYNTTQKPRPLNLEPNTLIIGSAHLSASC